MSVYQLEPNSGSAAPAVTVARCRRSSRSSRRVARGTASSASSSVRTRSLEPAAAGGYLSYPNHRIRRPNHRISRHLLRSSAQFAAWALGISSPPDLCRRRPWSAPQVLHSSKTGCPWIITTRRRLQHYVETRPYSAAVSMMLSTTATAIPDLLPRSRSFTTGASIFTSPTRAPNCWASSTSACTSAAVSTFSWQNWAGRAWNTSCDSDGKTPSEKGRRAKAPEFIENLTAVKRNSPLIALEFLERILLNKCPIVIQTVDATSSQQTYVAEPITSLSKLQIRPSISKIYLGYQLFFKDLI